MTYQEFKQKYIGQEVDDGYGNYLGECVSLVKRFILENNWPYRHGNANQWNYGDDFYTWIPYTSGLFPIQSDFVVFNYSPNGHIGICESADQSNIVLFNQNFPKGNDTNPAQINNFNYQHVMGWLRPKGVDVITQQGIENALTELRHQCFGKVDQTGLQADVQAVLNGDDNTMQNIIDNYFKAPDNVMMAKVDCKPNVCPDMSLYTLTSDIKPCPVVNETPLVAEPVADTPQSAVTPALPTETTQDDTQTSTGVMSLADRITAIENQLKEWFTGRLK
jgi:surface antigen